MARNKLARPAPTIKTFGGESDILAANESGIECTIECKDGEERGGGGAESERKTRRPGGEHLLTVLHIEAQNDHVFHMWNFDHGPLKQT